MNKPNGGAAFPSAALAEHAKINRAGMSLREYAAITLRVPDTGNDWLDAMIVASLRIDIATKAMAALIISPHTGTGPWDAWANAALDGADAMLEAAATRPAPSCNEVEQLVPLAHLQRLVDTMVNEIVPLHHGREFPALTSAQAFLASLPQQAE